MIPASATLRSFVIRNKLLFLIGTIAAVAFRAFFFFKYRMITDDSVVYADIAKNWLRHGVYGQVFDNVPEPTFIRMPGYPIFIILVWLVAGVEHYTAIVITQIAVDVATCFVVADLTRRLISERTSKIAFVLAALCPFFANYAVVPLTETLAIFFAAMAFDAIVAAIDHPERKIVWVLAGSALACGILLRPDGGILMAVFVGYTAALTVRQKSRAMLLGLLIATTLAVFPLVPWTIRNSAVFHRFQPLTPMSATMPWEFIPKGFQRWSRTWIADYSSLEDVWFKVDGTEVSIDDLPPRAYDTEDQRQRTDQLLRAYVGNANVMSPEIDSGFNQLAEDRIRTHRLRYYLILPLLRAADLWLRPRTEMLPIDPHWWRLREDDPPQFWTALLLGFVNLIYLLAAAYCLARHRIRYASFFLAFVLIRTAFLAWMPNPEPRYVLECYPLVLAIASGALDRTPRHYES